MNWLNLKVKFRYCNNYQKEGSSTPFSVSQEPTLDVTYIVDLPISTCNSFVLFIYQRYIWF